MTDETHVAGTIGTALNAYGWATWAWVVVLSISGGAANFFRKLRLGQVRPFNFVEFCGEIFVAGFTGICTFLLCEAAHFDPLLSSALVAIAGHMGSRALFLFERIFAKRFGVDMNGTEPVGIGAPTEDVTERGA